jgi:hypothetical protein
MKDITTSSKPIGVNFIVGSTTTFSHKAPNFDIVYLDPDTMLPIDLETWVFDLDFANNNDTPSWYQFINVREEYNLTDLSPSSVNSLSDQILTDQDVCSKYKYNKNVGWDHQAGTTPCTKDDMVAYHCQTGTSDSDELFKCQFGDSFWKNF